MSTTNIVVFLQRVADDTALQEQIKALGTQEAVRTEEVVLQLAAEQGLPFTVEELQAFVVEQAKAAAEQGELSDDELEQVAGGNFIVDILKYNPAQFLIELHQQIPNIIGKILGVK